MTKAPKPTHASDSSEQRSAESVILRKLERQLKVPLDGRPDIGQHIELDGFADGDKPVCVEVWAHQGTAKGGQPAKVMRDFCKLLLVERLLGRECRKVVAVCDQTALAFLENSWQGRFADEFGIERIVVGIDRKTRERLLNAQRRQYR